MGDTTASPDNNYCPACDRVLQFADRAIRFKKEHGIVVERATQQYFRLISERVKPGPELNGVKALTTVLARVHHLRGLGREKESRDRLFSALERGVPVIGGFEAQTGIAPRSFIERLDTCIRQYRKIHSTNLDLNSEMKLENYAMEIDAGGISLPTLLVRLADLSLDLEEAVSGLPNRERLSDSDRQLLATKLKTVWFPFADTIGWVDASYKIRRNGVLWDENSVQALKGKEEWLRGVFGEYFFAGAMLKVLAEDMVGLLSRNEALSAHSAILQGAIVQDARVKSPAAIVIKEDKFEREGRTGEPIMDMVAVRVIFDCDDDTAQFLGREISEHMRGLRNFRHRQMQDYFKKPKKTGYRAVHVTGHFRPRGELVPVEFQFTNRSRFLDSLFGESSRLVYKSGAGSEAGQLMGAFKSLFSPIISAASDIRGAMENPIPVSMRENRQDMAAYTVLIDNDAMTVRMKSGSLAADVAFRALNKPRMVDVHDLTDSGRKISFFKPCPSRVRLVPRQGKTLNSGLIGRILSDSNISLQTKQIVRDIRAGE